MDEEIYEYSAEGPSCPVCAAMEDYYEYEPARPHEYCDCVITLVGTTSDYPWDYRITGIDRGVTPGGEEYIARAEIEVTMTCPDGPRQGDYTETIYDDQDVIESNYSDSDAAFVAEAHAEWMYQNYCVGLI